MTGLLHSAGLQNRKKKSPTKHYKLPTIHLSLAVGLFSLSWFYPLTAPGESSRWEWFQQPPTDLREVAASWRWPHSGSPGRWWRPRWPRRLPACGSWSALPSSWCAGSARWGTAPCNPPGASSGALREKETRWDKQFLKNAALSLPEGGGFGSVAWTGNKCSNEKKEVKILLKV